VYIKTDVITVLHN